MKTGVSVFIAAFFALGASWYGFVYGSIQQLGMEKQTVVLQSGDNWPQQRTGEATLGLQVYRKYGCAACHTVQVRQMGVRDEISLTDLAGNKPEDFKQFVNSLLMNVNDLMASSNVIAANLDKWNGQVPVTLYSGEDSAAVAALSDKLKGAKVKTDARVVATGSDIWRGWGMRQSVAADYLYDAPLQLGSLRAGPDLSLIGVRESDVNWQLQHLYAPASVVKDSTMPPFHFLFEVRKKADGPASSDALVLPKEFAPVDGMEVVPTPEARELVAYLLSLKANQPLYEAPFTPAITATNK
jgi:cbb3-type cytochrome oxidase cytochrome c subunit